MEGVLSQLGGSPAALPSEALLAIEYGVSRNAIREALDLLRGEGMVTRKRGVGTFVTGPKLRQRLDRLEGLAESLRGQQFPVDNHVLSVGEAPATPFVANKLGVEEGSPVAFVERLRSVGGIPLSLDSSYLRAEARRQNVTVRESLVLGVALSVNNIGTGVGAGVAGLSPAITTAMAGALSLLAIGPGSRLACRLGARRLGRSSSVVGGMLLIAVAIALASGL